MSAILQSTFPSILRWLSRLTAATAVVGVMAASPLASAQQTVKFMDIPGPGNMLVRVAIAKGFCKQQGLTCELQMIPAAPLGVQAMMANTIDSAIAPLDVMIGAINNGTKMKMVTGSLVSNLLMLVTRNDMAAPNADKPWPQYMSDLKGKRIGVTARGASTETGMRYLFSKAGLNPDDATYVAVGGAVTAYNALASKQIDAAMIVEPVGAICRVSKTCRVAWRGSENKEPAALYSLNGASNGLVFTQKFIDQKPDVIAAVIRAVKSSDAFINDPANFEEVVKIANSYFKFELPGGDEVMRSNLTQFIKDRTYSAAINREAIKGGINYLVEAKLINAPMAVSELVYDNAP